MLFTLSTYSSFLSFYGFPLTVAVSCSTACSLSTPKLSVKSVFIFSTVSLYILPLCSGLLSTSPSPLKGSAWCWSACQNQFTDPVGREQCRHCSLKPLCLWNNLSPSALSAVIRGRTGSQLIGGRIFSSATLGAVICLTTSFYSLLSPQYPETLFFVFSGLCSWFFFFADSFSLHILHALQVLVSQTKDICCLKFKTAGCLISLGC